MKGGRMILRNDSPYPDDEVRELAQIALSEIDLRGNGVYVQVKSTRKCLWRGWAYNRTAHFIPPRLLRRMVGSGPPKYDFFIEVMLGRADKFPSKPFVRNGVVINVNSWQEALVMVAAHEGMHVQHYHDQAYPYTGERRTGGNRVEPKCDAFSMHMVRRFRREQSSRTGRGVGRTPEPGR